MGVVGAIASLCVGTNEFVRAVTRDGGDLGLGGGSIGRRTFERMRFVFGIGDGRSTAEGATARGADVVDLANEERRPS